MSFDLKIVNRDLVIVKSQLKTVVDSEKLIQDILKLCLTPVGSNPSQAWYGSFLHRVMVGSTLDPEVTIQISKTQLETALKNLQSLQDAQVKTMQRVSADEQLGALLDIIITQNADDPTLYDITVKALTKGTKPISPAFKIDTIT